MLIDLEPATIQLATSPHACIDHCALDIQVNPTFHSFLALIERERVGPRKRPYPILFLDVERFHAIGQKLGKLGRYFKINRTIRFIGIFAAYLDCSVKHLSYACNVGIFCT